MNTTTENASTTGPARVRTLTIDHSRACPSVEPIPADGFSHGGHHFTAAELGIVGNAIDAGVFYTEDLKAFCWDAWVAAHPAIEHCLTASDGVCYELLNGLEHAQRREKVNALREAVSSAPRGTWGLLRHDWADTNGHSGVTYSMFISDGQGEAQGVQTGPIHHAGRVPTYDDAIKSMVGYEIYLADGAEKARREQARGRAVIRDARIVPGMVLRNVRIGSNTYSTGTVEQVSERGHVKLLLVKRGSRNRWNWTGLAHVVEADTLAPTLPAYGALVVSEH